MKTIPIILVLASLFSFGCRSARRQAEGPFYEQISIDLSDLKVGFHDPIITIPGPNTEFYWPFFRHDGHCSLDHFKTTTRNGPKIRYNIFDLDSDKRITSRSKHQILLTGAFGTFYSETRYHYAPFYQSTNTSFRIYAYGNSLESEPPQVSDSTIPREQHLSAVLKVVT